MVPFHEHVRILHLSARARLEAYSRLFRFTTYEDIDAKDFAEKTGMNVKSVSSMIKQARSNAVLYEEMLEAGYTDGEFPGWWFSPARGGGKAAKVAQVAQTDGEAGEGGELRREVDEVEGVEGYDPTPPRRPAPREDDTGRPALQRPSDPTDPSDAEQPIQAVHHPSPFSDAELSLLKERGVTQVTPGRWMHTADQADGRIIARASVPT